MFANIAIKIIANAGALWAGTRYISGFSITPAEFMQIGFFPIDPWVQTFIVGGAVLAILNTILYPFLKVIADLLPFITAAMMVVAANIVILYFADSYLGQLAINGFKPLWWSAVLIGVTNTLL